MNNSSKTLNAIRLHLVLLNEGNEAVQFRLTEIIKARDLTNLNSVKDFLIAKFTANQRNPPHYLNGFMKILEEKYGRITNQFPNDLNDFDITACYPIALNLLSLSRVDMRPFDKLKDIRNKYYGHLNFISIDDGDYSRILNDLKSIIDTLTQSDLNLQLDLKSRISQIEKIQNLSHLNANDWKNLNEIIIDLILNNKDMFLTIAQHNKDLKDFIDNYPSMQLNLTNSINAELLKLAHIIQGQSLSQTDIDQIALCVSTQLNIEKLKLSFTVTLERELELLRTNIKSDISESKEELKNELKSHINEQFEGQMKEIDEKLKPLEQLKCKLKLCSITYLSGSLTMDKKS